MIPRYKNLLTSHSMIIGPGKDKVGRIHIDQDEFEFGKKQTTVFFARVSQFFPHFCAIASDTQKNILVVKIGRFTRLRRYISEEQRLTESSQRP